MKVKVKKNVKYNHIRFMAGEIFEVLDSDKEEFAKMDFVEIVPEPTPEPEETCVVIEEVQEPSPVEVKKPRKRKKKEGEE